MKCPLFINGEHIAAVNGETFKDINPFDESVFATVDQASKADAELALESAKAAFSQWRATTPSEREAILNKAASLFIEQQQELVDILINETGSTFGKSMFETGFVANMLTSAAGEARRLFGSVMPSDAPGKLSLAIRQPLGIIFGISPFNFPFILAVKKVCMAIAAGNCFILKPSEQAAVVGLKIAEIFSEAGLPNGVLNVLQGDASEFSDSIIADPAVKMITFTGSTKVGKNLAVKAAQHLKKITLEMGGKNPFIVLADADIDDAVNAAVFGMFIHQGQICMAASKIIVEAPIYAEFCEKFVAKAKTLKVGDPSEHDTIIGPLIRSSQAPFIAEQLAEASDKGAKILCGGSWEGNLFQPTVVTGVTEEMRLYDEESFGPVVSLYKAATAKDALNLANKSDYGLSSAVMTKNIDQALSFAHQLQAGMVHINGSTVFDEPHVPFGGVGNSGMGREGGQFSMEAMTELKWITIQQGKGHYPF